jgi:hypothetical protein
MRKEPKQETLEEAGVAYSKIVSENHTSHMLGFVNGAKWQADNIIEELEMHILINEHDWSRNPQVQFRDFIEQFKNK